MTSQTARALTLTAVLFAAAAATAAADDLWLHVRVDEERGGKVTVNLPLALIEKAIPLLPEEHARHLHFDAHRIDSDLADLRAMWREVRDSPDMTFVTVEEDDETVRVWKEGGYLHVRVRERGDETSVDVRVPAAVVDALLSGEGEELDLEAAIDALVAQGEGDLVTVRDRDDQVRVWVDRVAEAGLEGR